MGVRHLAALFAVCAAIASTQARASSESLLDWSAVEEVLNNAIASKVFPGCVAAVRVPAGQIYLRAFGKLTYGDYFPPASPQHNPDVTVDTMYDLASLTKVIGTTSAAALLVQRGYLDLNMPLVSPSLLGPAYDNNGKEGITSRNLLLHNAGFPPDPVPNYWDPAFGCPATSEYHPEQTFSCSERIFHSMLNQTLVRGINTKYVYSDLSMITLAFVVGTLVKRHALVAPSSLNAWCAGSAEGLSRLCHYEAYIRTQVVEPLGIQPTGFLPDQSLWVNIAPTWNDTEYRHRVVQGQVSDGNSYASGGIAGHAGLFSSAGVLASFMAALLEAPTSAADTQFLTAATVAEFTTAVNLSQSSRALGWDTNSYVANTYRGCADLSEKTFTHTGFTGTQVCGDPTRSLATVLLTNRVYPEKFGQFSGIHATRKAFNAAVRQVVDKCAQLCGTPTCSCLPASSPSHGLSGAQIALIVVLAVIIVAMCLYWKRGAIRKHSDSMQRHMRDVGERSRDAIRSRTRTGSGSAHFLELQAMGGADGEDAGTGVRPASSSAPRGAEGGVHGSGQWAVDGEGRGGAAGTRRAETRQALVASASGAQ